MPEPEIEDSSEITIHHLVLNYALKLLTIRQYEELGIVPSVSIRETIKRQALQIANWKRVHSLERPKKAEPEPAAPDSQRAAGDYMDEQQIKQMIDQTRVQRDISRAAGLTPEVEAEIWDLFQYHTWDETQMAASLEVRRALAQAVKILVHYVPPCPDRSTAIRKLREAGMDANSAITHRGRY